MRKLKIVVGISGASGAIYGVRFLEILQKLGIESHVIISNTARKTIQYETDQPIDEVEKLCHVLYDSEDIGAAISSGSFPVDGMVVVPCSIKSLASIANSYNDNLITRAADVQLKERRKLVLVVRETPFHLGHLKHMVSVSEMGGVILPPIPSFYHLPQTIDDVIHHTIGKILDQFGIDGNLFHRWKGLSVSSED